MLKDTTQRKFFEMCPQEWIRTYRRGDDVVTLINGTEILFRSLAAPGKLSSLELDWFLLDEVGEVDVEVFRMLQGRLRRQTGVNRCGVVGNPAGPAHWTYEYFVEKARNYPEQYHLTTAPTFENAYLPQSYINNMEISFDKNSPYYQRFVLGSFCAFEGAYWSNFLDLPVHQNGHVLDFSASFSMFTSIPKVGRIIDFGFEHPFVCMWYATDGEKIVFFDEYYKKHGLLTEHVYNIRERETEHWKLLGNYAIASSLTDHDAQARAEIANCHFDGKYIGFEVQPAEKKVMESILLVQTLFGQRRVFVTDRCSNARKEIISYRAKPNSVKEEPFKERDDTCDCIKMACWAEMNHLSLFQRGKDMSYGTRDLEFFRV